MYARTDMRTSIHPNRQTTQGGWRLFAIELARIDRHLRMSILNYVAFRRFLFKQQGSGIILLFYLPLELGIIISTGPVAQDVALAIPRVNSFLSFSPFKIYVGLSVGVISFSLLFLSVRRSSLSNPSYLTAHTHRQSNLLQRRSL